MAKRTTGSITPGRIRKVSAGISRTQPVFIDDDDDDDFDFDENVLDASKWHLSIKYLYKSD
jgi:hypothetical protein